MNPAARKSAAEASRSRILPAAIAAAALAGLGLAGLPAQAAEPPIRIGVIGEEGAVAGTSITKAAQLAADEMNAKGGVGGRKIEVITYDDHSSSADAVRAFQRAVKQDHVNAVIATYISEVALAIEPWAARLHMPTVTTGAATTKITKYVHDDYKQYKYMFHGWINSKLVADLACESLQPILIEPYHLKTAVVMSENAAWTEPLDEEVLEVPAEGRATSCGSHPLQS